MKKENEKEGTKAELMNAMRPENNAIKPACDKQTEKKKHIFCCFPHFF